MGIIFFIQRWHTTSGLNPKMNLVRSLSIVIYIVVNVFPKAKGIFIRNAWGGLTHSLANTAVSDIVFVNLFEKSIKVDEMLERLVWHQIFDFTTVRGNVDHVTLGIVPKSVLYIVPVTVRFWFLRNPNFFWLVLDVEESETSGKNCTENERNYYVKPR